MAERNFNNRSQQNHNEQRPFQPQPNMQNNRQPPMQNNRPQFRHNNRSSSAQGNQQSFKQDNRQPPRENYEQSGRQFNEQTRVGQNNQQSCMGRSEQQREVRNENQQNGSRNEQQCGGRYNEQRVSQNNQQPRVDRNGQQYRDQNELRRGGQNNQQPRVGYNGQQSGGRNEQQSGTRNHQRVGGNGQQNENRNEQQRGGQNIQPQRMGQNNQQPRVGYNGQQSGGRNEQQSGTRNHQRVGGNGQQNENRNEQQRGGQNIQPQRMGQNNQQPRVGCNGRQSGPRDEQQSGTQNDQRVGGNRQQNENRNKQQRGGQNIQPQRMGQNNQQPRVGYNGQQSGGRNEQQSGTQNDQRVGGNRQQYGDLNEQRRPGQNMQQHVDQNAQQPRVDREQQGGGRNEQQRGGETIRQQGVTSNVQQPGVNRNDQKPQMKANEQPLRQQGFRKDEKSLQQKPHQGPSKENPVKNSVTLSGGKTTCSELAIPRRADFSTAGTKGRPILIEANHLPMILPPKMPIAVHYDVDIVPDKPKNLVGMAMEQFRKQYYPQRYPAYDGRKNLYSSSPLPIENGVSCEIKIMEDDREKTFKVTVKQVATIDLNALQEYFQVMSNGRKLKLPEEAIHCLEVVLRSAASNGCTSVGQSFFTRPRTMMDLGEGMEMYSGIYQSAILGWRPFLNVDVAHKPFPKCLKITDLFNEFCKDKIVPEDMKKADKFLRTLKVRYEIPGDKNSKRISRVNQLDKNATTARFTNENGIEMTVADYYEKVKKYKLRYPDLPCLWVGNKQKRILYPAELCTLVENQVTNRTMTPQQTSKMIKYAATSSTVRKNKIMASIKAANYNNDKTVNEFGIKVSDDFVTIEARVLDPPKLQYSQSSVVPRKGVWRSDKFKNAKSLNNWVILCVDGRVREAQLQSLAESVMKQGKFVGMNIERPSTVKTLRLSNQRAQDEFKREFENFKGVDLIFVVIPEDKSTYGNVKRAAELQVGVLTQCIRSKNIFNLKDTTIANILLKVNAKLNGVNHCLFNTPLCLNRPCIIMGADVTHPSPESNGMVPSVAAVTASHDPKAFQYNISWRLQPPTQEIITDLANIVKQHLIFFFRKNNVKPERIIFFRDGVSEGQFQHVLQEEVMAIRNACLMLEKEGTYKPAITFIVVQKRHHTRLFPKNPRDSEDKNLNVPAGTVVDTTITHPTDLDFYLVSHASIQGVARPTKYRKLWDDFGMHEDELEELTYHLCHMFSRCNRSVSYPAPTYYAHLAATRAKVYCEGINLSMNDNLEAMQKKLDTKKEIISGLPMYFV